MGLGSQRLVLGLRAGTLIRWTHWPACGLYRPEASVRPWASDGS